MIIIINKKLSRQNPEMLGTGLVLKKKKRAQRFYNPINSITSGKSGISERNVSSGLKYKKTGNSRLVDYNF